MRPLSLSNTRPSACRATDAPADRHPSSIIRRLSIQAIETGSVTAAYATVAIIVYELYADTNLSPMLGCVDPPRHFGRRRARPDPRRALS